MEETVLQYSFVGSRFVLQYKLYCDLKAAGGLALYCNTMHSRVVIQQAGRWVER